MTYAKVDTAGTVSLSPPELNPFAVLTVVDPASGENSTDIFNDLKFTDLGGEDLELAGTETTSGSRFVITIKRVEESE